MTAISRRRYSTGDVSDLLDALERQGADAARLGKAAERAAAEGRFEAYSQFRDKIGEFRALCILVEGRLRHLGGADGGPLRNRYINIDTQLLALLVHCSMRLFFILSAKTVLPLGAREIFVTELRSLYEASEKLRTPAYADHLSDEVRAELETAEMILEEIIDKAPSMLQF